MKTLLLGAAACMGLHAAAQTTHQVVLTAMDFVPHSLTIDVGDSVVFTNGSTEHNVNGTQTTYPANPESFGNSSGTNWTYGHKFTITGSYSFRCDVHPTMTGSIVVVDGLSITEKPASDFSIYPNPANTLLYINTGDLILTGSTNLQAVLYDIAGKELLRMPLQNTISALPVDALECGLYFCTIYDGTKLLTMEKIMIQ